jgi:hypothetical protein
MLPLSVRLKGFVAGVFFSRLQGVLWVQLLAQLGPPRPPREGAVPDSPVQNKMTRIALAGRSKISC